MFILHYLLLFAIRRQYTIDKATARLVTTPHDTIIVTTVSDDDSCSATPGKYTTVLQGLPYPTLFLTWQK